MALISLRKLFEAREEEQEGHTILGLNRKSVSTSALELNNGKIVTGVFLAMHYTPHVDLAFNSVEHIMRDVEGAGCSVICMLMGKIRTTLGSDELLGSYSNYKLS
uniref:Cytochrome b/b6 N-terminal region profile domain-containing protein n=1 Tax=Salix viminalis TaxID=40686 RepID=A0A6N2N6J0_SALVM